MAIRGHGEGSIYQARMADGWAPSAWGNKRKVFYGKTRREVQDQMTIYLREKQEGTLITGPSQSLEHYLIGWLEDVKKSTVRARTLDDYEEIVRLHLVPTLGKTRLDKLTPQHLARLYSQKLAAGLSARRVQYIHAVVHGALRQAVRWNLIARSPADAVQAPRPKRKEMQALSPEQARTLLAGLSGDPMEALYTLAITSGMRQGELLALRWQDVDLASGRLQVRHTLQRRRGGWSLEEPKTEKSRRSVALTTLATETLRTHRARQLEARILVGPEWEDHGLVFTNDFGRPLDGSHLLTDNFYPLLARVGLPRMRFHDLRHSAATLLLSQGVHAKIVQDLLGHSTINLTLDTYSHVLPNLQREAATKMDALLR